MQDIFNAILMGVFLAFTIGPVFFMLLQTSITKGFRAAFVFDLGVILGDVFFILITYFSARSFLEKIKDNPYLFIFGGLILFFYGLISFLKERKLKKNDENFCKLQIIDTKKNYLALFVKGFLLNAINVGVLGFWLGIIIVMLPRLEFDPQRVFTYFAFILLSYLVVDILKIVIAKELRHKLTPLKIHQIKQVTNIIIFLFGLLLIIQAIFPEWKQMLMNWFE